MSETLWAVIIGGVIGVIGSAVVSIPSLVANERRWKKEKKLEHLRAERKHKEEQYMQMLPKIPNCMEGGGDYDTLTRIFLVLPVDIGKELSSLLWQAEGKHLNKLEILPRITRSVRESLEETDKEISELMS